MSIGYLGEHTFLNSKYTDQRYADLILEIPIVGVLKLGKDYEMSQSVKGKEFGVQGSLVIIFPFCLHVLIKMN